MYFKNPQDTWKILLKISISEILKTNLEFFQLIFCDEFFLDHQSQNANILSMPLDIEYITVYILANWTQKLENEMHTLLYGKVKL